jgi:hypothetical protein
VARGTTRDRAALDAIEATGTQAVIADPDRLSTLMPQIEGVAVVCWLMGSARGEPEVVAALHGPRLDALLERLVDTPVRGFVYEAAGSVQSHHLERGAEIVCAAGERYRLPVRLLQEDPAGYAAWLEASVAAVERTLEPR